LSVQEEEGLFSGTGKMGHRALLGSKAGWLETKVGLEAQDISETRSSNSI
jgi:hypothetical protein